MKSNSPKILFFVTEDWFVCSHWLPLIGGAKDAGFDVVVVTRTDPRNPHNQHAELIRQRGARVVPFNISRRGFNPFRECQTILRLARIYRAERPDIVHHVAMKPMLYGSLVAHLLRVPHAVNWVAGMGWMFVSENWRAKLLRSVVRRILGALLRATSVIVENKDDQQIIAGIGVPQRYIYLIRGAGVDTLRYAATPESADIPLVVLPARMLWDKGVGEFVDAARLLKSRGVKGRFVLVGDPDDENPASVSRQQLNEWRDEGVVEWWGRREDIPQVLAQAHIVCLPSYREGLPKSLLEAASCARPIVTTDVPGCREIVCDGENGLLVEVRNATALAEALARLLADADLRQQLGRRGRTLVEAEFSEGKVVQQTLAIYREILGQ